MSQYAFTTQIEAPVEVVFDLWTNLDRMHEWVGGVTKVTPITTGPIDAVGARYTVWFGAMKSLTEVIEADRPRRFATRFGNRILRGQNIATFDPDGTGTRLIQTFETEGLIPAIMARLFALGSYRGSFRWRARGVRPAGRRRGASNAINAQPANSFARAARTGLTSRAGGGHPAMGDRSVRGLPTSEGKWRRRADSNR